MVIEFPEPGWGYTVVDKTRHLSAWHAGKFKRALGLAETPAERAWIVKMLHNWVGSTGYKHPANAVPFPRHGDESPEWRRMCSRLRRDGAKVSYSSIVFANDYSGHWMVWYQ